MAPKKKFSREDIIDAAFDIAKVEGIDSITIRKVAQKLESSIAPIYVNFNDIEELIKEVVMKTVDISRQMLAEQNSGEPFRDIGIASIKFAKEYSVLFRDLIMKNSAHMQYESNDISVVIEQMEKDPTLAGFSEEELQTILLKMQIFQTGLSVMVANGLLPENFSEEMMIEMLDSTAEDVIATSHFRKEGMLDELKRRKGL
ncbi:TetR family transcriptional regulator [Virgibacillus profundi]|uniref:TetR family transcriptional regulator n=1 Tax=Virgibacillus profundi TaxID=2024555 RepID=A0A2A2IAA1_9BACI|nr:TetR family transcriptional regulator [Virgibacillus profundi]PAV28050.1 TetR family transcriptional regulator [Virgibacillus profundi]PXY52354.1 TetR/AcrR family transcriptional regulator [Virgibacillus profundi]